MVNPLHRADDLRSIIAHGFDFQNVPADGEHPRTQNQLRWSLIPSVPKRPNEKGAASDKYQSNSRIFFALLSEESQPYQACIRGRSTTALSAKALIIS